MLLPESSEIVCAINADHYFLKQEQTIANIKKCLELRPSIPLVLERKVYFTFHITVVSNPYKEDFLFGRFNSRSEITEKCSKRGGAGLNCVFSDTKEPLLVKFHHLLDCPFEIMFWSKKVVFSRSSIINRKLKETKDQNRMNAIGMRYLQEYYGGAAPTIIVIAYLRLCIKNCENNAVSNVVRKLDHHCISRPHCNSKRFIDVHEGDEIKDHSENLIRCIFSAIIHQFCIPIRDPYFECLCIFDLVYFSALMWILMDMFHIFSQKMSLYFRTYNKSKASGLLITFANVTTANTFPLQNCLNFL